MKSFACIRHAQILRNNDIYTYLDFKRNDTFYNFVVITTRNWSSPCKTR